MGVQERKTRERAALRKKIIQSANKLFLKKGYEGTSIRLIAQDIEYSPATIYLYFKDKNELFRAILDNAFKVFLEHLAATKIIADPLSRLRELCRQYLKYAKDYPAFYDLIFISTQWTEGEEASAKRYSGETFEVFVNTLNDCRKNGYFISKVPVNFALIIWSFIHGLASLLVKDRLSHLDGTHNISMLDQAINEFFNTLERA